MTDVPFLRVASFGRDLPRELVQFEANVRDALMRIGAQSFNVTDLKRTSYAAQSWDLVRVDPTGTTGVSIFLPSALIQGMGDIAVLYDSDDITPVSVIPVGSTLGRKTVLYMAPFLTYARFSPNPATNDWMVVS